MANKGKTKQQMAQEVERLCAQVAELEQALAEHRRAEDDLRESETRFRLMAENSPDAIYIYDFTARKTIYFNRDEFLGYSREELTAPGSIRDRVHPEDDEVVARHWDRLVSGETSEATEVEFRVLNKRDEVEWIHTRTVVLARDGQGKPAQILDTMTIITARKQAEEALRHSEERYRAVVEQSAENIYFMDIETRRVLEANLALQCLLGYTPDEMRELTIYDFIAHEREGIDYYIQRILNERTCYIGERRYRKKDGTLVDVEVNASHISYGGREALCIVSRDITERRQVEQERERLIEELNSFSHTVAHDLKGPLNNIVGFASILLGEDDWEEDEEVARQCLQNIIEGCYRMRNIINELMLLAGLGQEGVESRALDMGVIVSEAQNRLSYMTTGRQVEFVAPSEWPTALGYGPWVEEVWTNYISNAIKYGGKPPRIEMGAMQQANGMVHFWVRDNGPGIAPEDQDKLFTPFKQFSQVKTEGHGLGLSIVRRIVERLGGEVGFESETGKGSVFFFTLPGG